MKKKALLISVLIYAGILFFILLLSMLSLWRSVRKQSYEPAPETEYIYVYVSEETKTTAVTEEPTVERKWTVKAHLGRIGIFDQEGKLIKLLDTYLKTLPKNDRAMLEEGISVHSAEELRSLIEDYTE